MASEKTNDGAKLKTESKGFVALSAAELQKRQLDKLLSNPDKLVKLPGETGVKRQREPKDFVRNIGGSCAGAGSGDFHVYRASRRREYARQQKLDEEIRQEQDNRAFQERMEKLRSEDEKREAKNRLQRQRKKQKRQAKIAAEKQAQHKDTNKVDTASAKQPARTEDGDDGSEEALVFRTIRVPQPAMADPANKGDADADADADADVGANADVAPPAVAPVKCAVPTMSIIEDDDF
ncbi:hypothetical protein THASP1DRAFT_29758 [Thamnocephalis sphaerospora]|uniref:DUF1168 domain protein n=1 Tax=Thamnocephalis sphaerospora TaxID=78915 RepID=A0A4P9XQV3_9FUNG|nr:hypothetical protein THASP1DRAFT_29758 [Thamnocephalis sphaerospora]|eukprot:RKP08437.1 hypothetical protein THASP1DRAFT_29758 [Thamnocephalis sphaerospora]